MYGAVPSLVDEGVRFAAFPDGSVDTFLRVLDRDGRPLSRATFVDRMTGARSAPNPWAITTTGGSSSAAPSSGRWSSPSQVSPLLSN